MASEKEDLETLFARRQEIDRALLEQHSREVAILFTDIVGSTRYFERHGDIAGLELVRRHNALLFPVVEAHRGWIVKTIGDAIMAVFERATDAVGCAVQMQQVLAQANCARPDQEPIQIRVGAHFGRALVEKDRDVYGDSVNTAARVVNEAKGAEIVISGALADQLAPADGHLLVPRGSFQPKGKAEALPVLLVRWGGEEPPAQAQPSAPAPAPAAAPSKEVFVLELQVGARGLKVVAIDGAADKGTVKAYSDLPVTVAQLDELASRFGTFMRGGGAESYLERVRGLGEDLFGSALSERARSRLSETPLENLRLQLDDQLVHVPWELLHDGQGFLCLRFAMGRVVSARSEIAPGLRPPGPTVGHALVVSNPSGDLEAAGREGDAVAGLLRDGYRAEVRHVRGPVTRAQLLEAVEGCALLHFAGHAEPPGEKGAGGFRLSDGIVSPEELARAVGQTAPALVFANSCHSSTGAGFGDAEAGPDLASALLMRGTRHFVGPRWDIADEDALTFALRFYERALSGVGLGEAVRQARLTLRELRHRPLSFASYVLYGEPRGSLPLGRAGLPAAVATRSSHSRDDLPAVVAGRTPSTAQQAQKPSRRRAIAAAGAGLLLLAAAGGAYGLLRTRGPVVGQASPAAAVRVGPVRLCVLPFKNISGQAELDFLRDGLTEAVMTDFGENLGVRLIERAQIDLDIQELEFSGSKYVDPSTRAKIGKIHGAEVVVMGGYQRVGDVVRAHARFVEVESGEVLHALRVERALQADLGEALFGLQDELSGQVRDAVPLLLARVRPD